MTIGVILLAATLLVPIAMLVACLSHSVRNGMLGWLALAPMPGLVAALFANGNPSLMFDESRLQVTLALDLPGRVLLGTAALLWMMSGAYAAAYLKGKPNGARFSICWLLTLTGSLGVFIAADLASFYILFALVSLAAYGLVVHDGTPQARRAGVIYLVLAVIGEIFLLLAFALLAANIPGDSITIRNAVAFLPASPSLGITMTLLLAGFGLKAGLLPLHVWLPIAHPAAPMPASAVLSGAIIKAGIIGLIRFLPMGSPLPDWGAALAAIGLATAFYGVVVGITQTNAKTVLAYSSVSQMGLVAMVLGIALAGGQDDAISATAFYAAHHVLAKGALFLAVGVVAATGARRLWPILVANAVLALGFGGLPPTGGYLAKLAVKTPLGEGIVGQLATVSAIGSALLMTHFIRRLAASGATVPTASSSKGLLLPWLSMAVAAVTVPWVLFPALGLGTAAGALSVGALWAALWPVLIGAALGIGLGRWEHFLPRVPEGDVVVYEERAARGIVAWGAPLERLESLFRHWSVASLLLLAIALILCAALVGTSLVTPATIP
jgi:formate hydrogenlyase subunit 3/multisubunit Na+/H+ antiporter MnhD subunit